GQRSGGNTFSRSMRSARGAISLSANARTDSRSRSISSPRGNGRMGLRSRAPSCENHALSRSAGLPRLSYAIPCRIPPMAPNPKLKLRDAADLPGPARAALAGALRALERGDLADAERRVTAALAHAPRHAEPHRLLGIVLQRLGRPAHAAASFREALAAKAGDADLLERLAHALAEADDLAAAIATARELLACDETSQAAYLLASLLERHGEIEAAAVVLERLLTRDPSRAPARAAYARGLFQRGRS